MKSNRTSLLGLGACLLLAACTEDPVAVQSAALEAVCENSAADVPAGGWRCPEPATAECMSGDGTANVDLIYHVTGSTTADICGTLDLSVSDPGPYTVGTHSIDIRNTTADAGTEVMCTAELTVTDTLPPVIEGHTVVLWPPNHKMVSISPADCFTARDACDGDVETQFTRVTSDEPEDALGDGHQSPDIVVADSCDAVQLRAERQGGGDGRMYKIEGMARDEAGNTATGTCFVMVPHDQSDDAAIDSGAVTTIDVCPAAH